MEFISRKHKTKYFFFLDTTINISYNYIRSFCDEIIRRNLEIYWTSCASFSGLNDPDTFKRMRRAGACRLIYGLESGSQRMLDYVRKRLRIDRIEQGLKWSCEAGIWTDLELIAGMPTETTEDIDATIAFLDRNKEYTDTVWLNRFFLSYDSAMARRPNEFNIANIRRRETGSDIDQLGESRYRYCFDETGGLKWPEKERQIEASYARVHGFLSQNRLLPCFDTSKINILLL